MIQQQQFIGRNLASKIYKLLTRPPVVLALTVSSTIVMMLLLCVRCDCRSYCVRISKVFDHCK